MSAVDLFLQYEFLQLALLASALMAILAGALGVPLVLRDMAMFGHGFAHVSYAGIALGLLAGLYPLGSALLVTILGALGMEWLRSQGILKGDTALAIVVSIGFALGVVIVSLAGGFTTDLGGYLFGSLFAVTLTDLSLMAPLGVGLLVVFGLLYKEIFYVTFDEQGARLSGLPVGSINVVLITLTASTIVLASRIVGLLLVASLLVIPAATALQAAESFRGAIMGSMAASLVSAVVGLVLAVEFSLAPGGAIVLVAGVVFAIVAGTRRASGLGA